MPRLIVEKGADKGKVLRVTKKSPALVGRDPKASFRLTDANISRLHFKVEGRSDGFFIADLKSMNGTLVNDIKIEEDLKLGFGDKVQIGESVMSFLDDEVKGDKDDLIGKTIQGYQISQRLGRGGMGTVFKALQISLHRTVALKILSPELIKDPNFITLFEQEAHAAAALNHPNIVQVYDFGKADNLYFFSMEYLDGGSVQDLLSKEKRLTPKKAVAIAIDALKGLEYAEKKKIVHRDIKPDNLMIGEEDAIKIGDLGLAKSLKEAPAVPEDGTILGTPHYVAPEQALGKPVDARVDIYGLGSTLYRIVSGTTPYHGNTVKEILIRKIKEEPKKLKEIDPELPENLCDLIGRMMAKDPDQRPQSASQILPELEAMRMELDGRSTTYPMPPRDTSVTLAVVDVAPPPRRLGAVALVLALAFGIGGFVAVRNWMRRQPVDPVVVNNAGSNQTLIEYAELMLKTARAAEPRERVAAQYDHAITQYQEIVDKAAGTPAATEAKKAIERLKKGKDEISAEAEQARREAGAKAEIATALDALETARVRCLADLQLGAVNAEISKLRDLIAKWDRTAAAKDAAAQVDRAAGSIAKIVPRLIEVRRAVREVAPAVEGNHFAEAYALLKKVDSAQDPPEVQLEVAAALRKLTEREKAYQQKACAKAREQSGRREFAEALAELGEAEKNLASPNLQQAVRDQRALVIEERQESDLQTKRAQLNTEMRRWERGWVEGILCAAKVDYHPALKAMKEATATLTIPEVRASADRTILEYELEGKAWGEFVARAAKGAPANKRLRNRSIVVGPKGESREIAEVTADGFMVLETIGRSTAEMGLKRSDVAPEAIYNTLTIGWDPLTTAEVAGILSFGVRRGVPQVKLMDFFSKKAKSSEEADYAIAKDLTVGTLARWAAEARLLYDYAKANEKSAIAEATRAYRVLKEQYAGTESYRSWSKQIDAWLAVH